MSLLISNTLFLLNTNRVWRALPPPSPPFHVVFGGRLILDRTRRDENVGLTWDTHRNLVNCGARTSIRHFSNQIDENKYTEALFYLYNGHTKFFSKSKFQQGLRHQKAVHRCFEQATTQSRYEFLNEQGQSNTKGDFSLIFIGVPIFKSFVSIASLVLCNLLNFFLNV